MFETKLTKKEFIEKMKDLEPEVVDLMCSVINEYQRHGSITEASYFGYYLIKYFLIVRTYGKE